MTDTIDDVAAEAAGHEPVEPAFDEQGWPSSWWPRRSSWACGSAIVVAGGERRASVSGFGGSVRSWHGFGAAVLLGDAEAGEQVFEAVNHK